MNTETDSVLSWEALCGCIVSPVLIIHVKIIHDAAVSARLPAPQPACLSPLLAHLQLPMSASAGHSCVQCQQHTRKSGLRAAQRCRLSAASGSEASSPPRCRKGLFTRPAPVLRLGFEKGSASTLGMKLGDEERREGGVIGRSVRSSDQRDHRTEEKGEMQREEREGAISSESVEGLQAMRIKGSTWPPTHCGGSGRGGDATDR